MRHGLSPGDPPARCVTVGDAADRSPRQPATLGVPTGGDGPADGVGPGRASGPSKDEARRTHRHDRGPGTAGAPKKARDTVSADAIDTVLPHETAKAAATRPRTAARRDGKCARMSALSAEARQRTPARRQSTAPGLCNAGAVRVGSWLRR
jgi:hypothetical protein